MKPEIMDHIRNINNTEVLDHDGNVSEDIIYALIEAVEAVALALPVTTNKGKTG